MQTYVVSHIERREHWDGVQLRPTNADAIGCDSIRLERPHELREGATVALTVRVLRRPTIDTEGSGIA
jgi:hypothetical protein